MALSQAAEATQATYRWHIVNYAPFQVSQYDPPQASGPDFYPGTTTPMAPWLTNVTLPANGGMSDAFVTTHSSYSSATAHIGTTDKGPGMLYYSRMECSFTILGGIVDSSGLCTQPTVSTPPDYSYNGTKPYCTYDTVQATPGKGPCDWTVTFQYKYQ